MPAMELATEPPDIWTVVPMALIKRSSWSSSMSDIAAFTSPRSRVDLVDVLGDDVEHGVADARHRESIGTGFLAQRDGRRGRTHLTSVGDFVLGWCAMSPPKTPIVSPELSFPRPTGSSSPPTLRSSPSPAAWRSTSTSNESVDRLHPQRHRARTRGRHASARDGTSYRSLEHRLDETYETATFVFDRELPTGPAIVEIAFDGFLNDKLVGFYRSTYTDVNGVDHVIATTQFENTDARRAFPCWDEPAFKATFQVNLTVPSELATYSNSPVESDVDLGNGQRTRELRAHHDHVDATSWPSSWAPSRRATRSTSTGCRCA